MQRLVPFRWPGCLGFHALLSGFPSISLNPASFLVVASEHCPCGSCSLIQPTHGLQKTAGDGGGQRFRAAVCILSSLVPPIAVLANTAHGHSYVQFIQGRLPVASVLPVPVAGRHLVVSGLWPSVLLECCIWQRYVLIFISQCHCEYLFHRLPWDFFLQFAVLCRCRCR